MASLKEVKRHFTEDLLLTGFSAVLDANLGNGRVILAFLVLLGFNVGFAIIAAALIAYKVSYNCDPSLYNVCCV